MAATVRASYFGAAGSEPAGVTAETGIKFNREDTQTGTTAIPIPSTQGTNYSWYKMLALEVTATSSTSISNRKFSVASTPTTGLNVYFKGSATYTQATNGNRPADVTTAPPNTPAGYTLATTTPTTYDATSTSTASTGRNGNFCYALLGIDNAYAGGANNNTTLPNSQLAYDEA